MTGVQTCALPILWSLTAPGPLPDGPYSVSAAQTDVDGHTGTTPARNFTVDTAPPVVTVDSPASGVVLGVTTVTVAGSCSTYDGPISVTLTGTTSASTTAACASGSYSVTIPSLPTGLFSVSASQSDGAGLVGTSAPVGFAVDLVAPTTDRKSTRLNSSHIPLSRMPSSA